MGLNIGDFDLCTKVALETVESLVSICDATGVKAGGDRIDSIIAVSPHFVFREDKKQDLINLIFSDPVFGNLYVRACGYFFARISSDDSYLLKLAYNLSQTVLFKESAYEMMSKNNKDSFISVKEIDDWFNDHITNHSVTFATMKTTEEKLAILLKANKLLMFSIMITTLVFTLAVAQDSEKT